MTVADRVRKRFEKCHQLARKHYEQGDLAKAKVEYGNCAQQLRYLAGLSSPVERDELLERARRFQQIAERLGSGEARASSSAAKPSESADAAAKTSEQELEELSDVVLIEKPGVRFADIAGLDKVKEQIKEAIVYPFKYPEEYQHFGVKPGGGMLLYGPPGCGKTMIAAAAAAECDALFINLKVSDIKNMYVGESEKNLRKVFAVAKQQPRAIIFFDEIDALASERSASMQVHERSLVSELLSQMDGLESKGAPRNSLVLAATNRPWDVDVALRRPGRFDATIFIPHPDLEARKRLFELNLSDKPVSESVSLEELARLTEGYASAEIADICQRAAMIPLRELISEKRPRRELTMSDFEHVLRGKKTMLTSWYAKAVKELTRTEEAAMFSELIEAAKKYADGAQPPRE